MDRLMNVIAVVTIKTEIGPHRIVTDVKKVHQRITTYFGQHALEIYGLPRDLRQVDIDYSNYKHLLQWREMQVVANILEIIASIIYLTHVRPRLIITEHHLSPSSVLTLKG